MFSCLVFRMTRTKLPLTIISWWVSPSLHDIISELVFVPVMCRLTKQRERVSVQVRQYCRSYSCVMALGEGHGQCNEWVSWRKEVAEDENRSMVDDGHNL